MLTAPLRFEPAGGVRGASRGAGAEATGTAGAVAAGATTRPPPASILAT